MTHNMMNISKIKGSTSVDLIVHEVFCLVDDYYKCENSIINLDIASDINFLTNA